MVPRASAGSRADNLNIGFYSQELADLIPSAKRAEIPSGHLSFLEKPVDLASAMLTFLLQK
jgi:pimeloyl-ACP methyl ester carboxylesterase